MLPNRLTRRRFITLAAAGSAAGAASAVGGLPAGAVSRGRSPSASDNTRRLAQAGPLPYRLTAPSLANDNARPVPQSIARQWDEEMLAAIRIDNPRPPVHARNLYHVSAAMWDAWAAYHPAAMQLFHKERATATNVAAARAETVSYAAYRLIRLRYERSPGAEQTQASLDARFASLGYNQDQVSTMGNSPAALGNRIFETVREMGLADGSNDAGNFAPPGGYQSVNPPLDLLEPGTTMVDPDRWQPLKFPAFIQQNGIPLGSTLQTNVCPHWAAVTSFAIKQTNPPQAYLDPGPPPLLGGATRSKFKADITQVVRYSSQLDPGDGVTMDTSPGARHNNPLGTNDGAGYQLNPVTGNPYAPNVVKRADYARVLAEYWADGPHSETPPGHWNVIANAVSDDERLLKRVGGLNPVVDDLEWDVKLYLALNGALHDAATGAWGLAGC